MNDKNNASGRFLNKLFGGLKMSWPAVILFAVGAAVLTAVFLIVPVFKNSSFERMGVYLEAWVLFAVIIMSNCKKPLESALKTFVFFLVSQPLIYLFQVPFSWLGWGIFSFYKTWLIWTVLTLPGAFVGWFITKRNWLSVLILSPVLAFLGYTLFDCASACLTGFPQYLLAALFCLAQIVLYIAAFLPKRAQKLVGALIPAAVVLALLLLKLSGSEFRL